MNSPGPDLPVVFEKILSLARDVNKARGVKAKATQPRTGSETCKANATDLRPRPRMRK